MRIAPAVLLALTAACASTPAAEEWDLRLPVHGQTGRGMEALVSGRLTYNPSTECLEVDGVVIVWPPGTRPTPRSGGRGVIVGDHGTVLLEGTDVKIGGGFVDKVTDPPAGLALPDPCLDASPASEVFEVNPFRQPAQP